MMYSCSTQKPQMKTLEDNSEIFLDLSIQISVKTVDQLNVFIL